MSGVRGRRHTTPGLRLGIVGSVVKTFCYGRIKEQLLEAVEVVYGFKLALEGR